MGKKTDRIIREAVIRWCDEQEGVEFLSIDHQSRGGYSMATIRYRGEKIKCRLSSTPKNGPMAGAKTARNALGQMLNKKICCMAQRGLIKPGQIRRKRKPRAR